MKHAGPEALDQLEDLLDQLRRVPKLVERKRGIFYRNARAFLHFHDNPSGLYADVRTDLEGDFERIRVTTATDKRRFLRFVRATVEP
jgi:hypothetical protein